MFEKKTELFCLKNKISLIKKLDNYSGHLPRFTSYLSFLFVNGVVSNENKEVVSSLLVWRRVRTVWIKKNVQKIEKFDKNRVQVVSNF